MTYICSIVSNTQGAVIIPISSISGSFNVNNQRNLLIVCPDGKHYASEIALRHDGEFLILNNGVQILQNITDISQDRGDRAWSISIRGLKQISNPTPQSYNAVGASVLSSNSSGQRRLTMQVDWRVKPADSIIYNEESIVVSSISYQVSANPPANQMTIAEAI